MPVPAPSPAARAVVTGASQNIGEALATELAARGHSLIVTARREDVLSTLAGRLTDKYGVTVEIRPADLGDPAERAKLVDELATRNISILCANAGTATFGPVASLDPEGEKAQVQLNVLGVHDLTLAVIPGMVERKRGVVAHFVFTGIQIVEQRMILEHHAADFAVRLAQVDFTRAGAQCAGNLPATRFPFQQSAQQPDQAGLAAAARPDDDDDLARCHRQRDIAQQRNAGGRHDGQIAD